VSELYR